MIHWIERRSNNTTQDNDQKQLKAELAELLEGDEKADKLICIAAVLLAGNSYVQSVTVNVV